MSDAKKRLCHYLRTATIAALDRVAEETGGSRSELLDLAGQLLATEYERERCQAAAMGRASLINLEVLRLARADHAAALTEAAQHFRFVQGRGPSPLGAMPSSGGIPVSHDVGAPVMVTAPDAAGAGPASGAGRAPAGKNR